MLLVYEVLAFGAALQRQRAGRKVAHLLVAMFVPLAWVLNIRLARRVAAKT
jgi:hypothetical protein